MSDKKNDAIEEAYSQENIDKAAQVLSRMGGTAGKAGRAFNKINKATDGKAGKMLAKRAKMGPGGMIRNVVAGKAGKLLNGSNNNSQKDSEKKNNANENAADTSTSTDDDRENTLGDATGKTVKATVAVTSTLMVIFLPIVLIIIFFAAIIAILSGGFSDGDSGSGGGSSGGRTTFNNVSGIGSYYTNGDTSNYFDNDIVYLSSDGVSTTYTIEEFINGAVYGMTGDSKSRDTYKIYAILIRTNILGDSDGVIEESDIKYVDINNSSSKEMITSVVLEESSSILVDDNDRLIITDFSYNDCVDCDDGINVIKVERLISEEHYTDEQCIDELVKENSHIIQIITSVQTDVNLDLKDTKKAKVLKTGIEGFLRNNGSSFEELNEFIKTNVDPVYGTGEGVAAAAVSLINFLYDNFDTKLAYYWGGTYVSKLGANHRFGTWSPVSRQVDGTIKWYNYVGLDCSGFAQWAIYNGGFKRPPRYSTADINDVYKYRCKIESSNCVGKVGDLINYRRYDNKGGHVQIIVGVDLENQMYYIAEAADGIVVTTRRMHQGRDDAQVYVLDMDANYYNANVRR